MSTGSSFDPQQAFSEYVLNNFYVGGNGSKRKSDRKLELISPMTEECFVKIPDASNANVDRAVRAAREPFDNAPWPPMMPPLTPVSPRRAAGGTLINGPLRQR
jgi:hypothetical protein